MEAALLSAALNFVGEVDVAVGVEGPAAAATARSVTEGEGIGRGVLVEAPGDFNAVGVEGGDEGAVAGEGGGWERAREVGGGGGAVIGGAG